ncbi:AI-2E family transporter [Afipia carboxidovorans]|uniref:AI-2E family transporter n=1 Tax=Afipia carboxidovorans TaxID=40137 RepID=UPI0030853E5A|nr:AI-2E family transporter [Afipia carboxidovorans]
MREHAIEAAGEPVPESEAASPPIIQRAEIVTFCLVALLVLSIVAVLYVARGFFLPVVTAVILGTMLSPAAKRLEALRIPRPVSAALIVVLTWIAFVFIIGLISVPVVEWFDKLPELGPILKNKLHVFDRPLAIWQQLQVLLGSPEGAEQPFQFPKVAWVQPTIEFLSPTFTEILLFFAVLVLFIASWPDLRRALVMNFQDRDSRLRTLRILNAIETKLGGYLLTVTVINAGLGIATGLACALAGTPNPAGLGALAATLNFIPIIGPILMFVVLLGVGIVAAPTLSGALVAPLAFAAFAFVEGHFVTPAIIGRRLALNALAVFLALAFWTWLWGPMGAFLSSPLLIVGLIIKEHMLPEREQSLPPD